MWQRVVVSRDDVWIFLRTLPTSPGNMPASHVLDVVGLFRIKNVLDERETKQDNRERERRRDMMDEKGEMKNGRGEGRHQVQVGGSDGH